MNHLFVYGTLLSPVRNVVDLLPPEAGSATPGFVTGALYNVGNYPALVLDSGGYKVAGEIYHLPDNFSFQCLDAYEDFYPDAPDRSLYRRIRTIVSHGDKFSRDAWVYVYNQSLRNLEEIRSGNYLQFIRER